MNKLKEGQRKQATILFADMKGFTPLSESLDPEETDDLMGDVFKIFEDIIKSYGGFVEKYIGDALVAVYGVEEDYADGPSRAINTGLDFLKSFQDIHKKYEKKGFDLAFRIGIYSGLVTTGQRGDYEVVTGHAMSVAARLEANARPNSILIGYDLIKSYEHDFICSEPFSIFVKGKEESIEVVEVQGRTKSFFIRPTYFIGRSEALEDLMKEYLIFPKTNLSGVLIEGGIGVGKTAVALEFLEYIKVKIPYFDQGILKIKSLHAQRPYYLVYRLFEEMLSFSLNDEEKSIINNLEEKGLDKKIALDFVLLYKQKKQEDPFLVLYELIKHFFTPYTKKPFNLIIFIDNYNLADKESFSFFKYVVKNSGFKPFFLLTGRPIKNLLFSNFLKLNVIPLQNLTKENSKLLFEKLIGENILENNFEIIFNLVGGVPLFLRECAKYFKNGILEEGMQSIQNIFLASLNTFSSEERNLLQHCSFFVHKLNLEELVIIEKKLSALQNNEWDEYKETIKIKNFLNKLVVDGIFEKSSNGNYRFSQALLKESLYESTLNYNKKIIHQAIVEFIYEKIEHIEKDYIPYAIMYHLVYGQMYEKALDFIKENYYIATTDVRFLKYIDLLIEYYSKDKYLYTYFYLEQTKTILLLKTQKSDVAILNWEKLIDLAFRHNNSYFLAQSKSFIASYYIEKGFMYKGMREIDHALYFLTKESIVRKKEKEKLYNLKLDIYLFLRDAHQLLLLENLLYKEGYPNLYSKLLIQKSFFIDEDWKTSLELSQKYQAEYKLSSFKEIQFIYFSSHILFNIWDYDNFTREAEIIISREDIPKNQKITLNCMLGSIYAYTNQEAKAKELQIKVSFAIQNQNKVQESSYCKILRDYVEFLFDLKDYSDFIVYAEKTLKLANHLLLEEYIFDISILLAFYHYNQEPQEKNKIAFFLDQAKLLEEMYKRPFSSCFMIFKYLVLAYGDQNSYNENLKSLKDYYNKIIFLLKENNLIDNFKNSPPIKEIRNLVDIDS